MKKLFLTVLTATALMGLCSNAWAGGYFGIRGGGEKYKVENTANDIDNGKSDYLLGGFFGYHYSFFRVEAEYMYHPERSLASGSYKAYSQTIMGNLFFSPPMKSFLHPYVMGGAGVALHSAKFNKKEDDNTAFAWQVGAGLELELSESVFLDCGARLTDMGSAEVAGEDFDTTSYLYYFGLRFEY